MWHDVNDVGRVTESTWCTQYGIYLWLCYVMSERLPPGNKPLGRKGRSGGPSQLE